MDKFPLFERYQKKGLIPALGSSDEIYKKLMTSVDDIVKLFLAQPEKLSVYVLVALDNNATEDEPVFEEVETLTSQNWQMLRSHFTNMPISLYRALILEAVCRTIVGREDFAAALWYIASDIFPLANISSVELGILTEFFNALGDSVEDTVASEWAISQEPMEIKPPKIDLKLAEFDAAVDEETLKQHLVMASGPHGPDNKSIPGANPQWSNSAPNWSYQFAPKAATGIAEVVDSVLADYEKIANANNQSIQNAIIRFFGEFGKSLKQALSDANKAAVSMENRNQLLWWKETLYSQHTSRSYRTMTAFETSIAMAYDLYHMLPATFPVSVDYILREAFREVHGKDSLELTLGEFLQQVAEKGNAEFLRKYIEKVAIPSGRLDLITFIAKAVNEGVDIVTEIPQRLGIIPDKKLSYDQLGVWLLHNLSANHLLKSIK